MVAEILKPTVQDLQKDVIELLEQISALMNRASTALSSTSSDNKYGEFQKEVIEAVSNVKELKLRMAIVAPMKAGKSTIINAIVGQEILPSRNAAMTTLPTEIIFDAKLEDPTLTLNAEILTVFQETVLALREKIQMLGMEQMQEKIAQYPHLTQLLQEIQDTVGFPTRPKTAGREEIIKALTGLNDIIRLCSLLEPTKDPLGQLGNVPCIHTPFWRSQTTQSEKLGNLVIVDTPGPNEAGENLRLAAVVTEQLQKSSMVLIVLDFTQLKTEAAEKVKKDVQQVINLRGKENLYVLINKIDQRRENDMTSEQVRQFVTAELGIGNASDTNRVFEVSARRAFSAANFMQELEQHLDVEVTQMQTSRSLAQEALGTRWENKLKRATVDELSEEAQILWAESGFELFLERAINALMERAAPKCIRSALNLSRNRLIELCDDVKLRSSAIAQDAEKLQHEVGALEADLKRLELCHSHLKEVDTRKKQLQQRLNKILENLKNEAQVNLETFFAQEEYQRANRVKQKDIEARQWLLTPLGDSELFPEWLSKRIKSVIEFKSSGVFEFSSALEAEEFANQAVAYTKQRAESLLLRVQGEIGREIEQARMELIDFLDKETKPIIERARTRLNEAFQVKLSLPQPSFKVDNTALVKPRISKQHRYIDQGYGERLVEKREWWHWLWIVPVKVNEKFKRPHKKEDYFTVSLKELIIHINQSIEINVDSINQGINKYLDEDFKQRVDILFEELDTYLRSYRDSLKQAQIDKNLSLDQQEKLVNELRALVPEVNANIKKVETYIERTDSLMRDK